MAADLFWRRGEKQELQERQLAMLRAFLSRRVLPFSQFYRERFERAGVKPGQLRTFADLARIPMMSKADIVPDADNPERWRRIVLEPTRETLQQALSMRDKLGMAAARMGGKPLADQVYDEYLPVHLTFTTGRSALATPVLYTPRDVEILKTAARRIFALSGIQRGRDTGVSVFPFAPHLAFWQVAFAGFETGLLVVSTGGGRAMSSAATLKLLERMKPTVLVGTPGYVYHLVQLALEDGLKLSRLRTIVLGAERVSAAYRDKLKSLLAQAGAKEVRVLATYGMTEAKKAWIQAEEGGRYILYPDFEIFEVVDPKTGEQVGEGEPGEIVYTMIDGSGSVVLRYRTGDLVAEGLVYQRCEAIGRVAPMLGVDIRRVSEIIKVKETLLDLNDLHLMLQGVPEIAEWQVELRKHGDEEFGLDEVWLKLALKPGVDEDGISARLNAAMHARYEMHFDRILFYSREDLARLLKLDDAPKELRIVDLRKK